MPISASSASTSPRRARTRSRRRRPGRTCSIPPQGGAAASGTGYLMVAGWLQSMGEQEGWKFRDGLHDNIAAYLHSGSAPCVQAARGERVAGLALDMRGASEKTKGAPIEVVVPQEGVGWEVEATGIVKGTKNLELAKKVADWGTSKAANELYAKAYAIVAHPE